jgi:hypothetical protein
MSQFSEPEPGWGSSNSAATSGLIAGQLSSVLTFTVPGGPSRVSYFATEGENCNEH